MHGQQDTRPALTANGFVLLALLVLSSVMTALPAAAQDLEPRRWTQLPTGTNVLAIGYAGRDSDIYFSPLIGITDGTAQTNAWLARYSHSFDWSGNTARVDMMLPYVSGTWQGLVAGEPGSRTIRDRGDPWLRLSVNFYGSPALQGQEFLNFISENPIRTTVGASVAVSLPLGAYDPDELINIGRNRYALRPQIGVLHQRGPWSLELTGSVFLFGNNREFIELTTLSQEPVWALQGHVTRSFSNGLWLGAGIAYAAGGKVDLDGIRLKYEVDNLLLNLVGSYRITDRQSVMVAWQRGRTQVDVGSDSDSWLLSWIFAWGG
jgi:hypothetical protein